MLRGVARAARRLTSTQAKEAGMTHAARMEALEHEKKTTRVTIIDTEAKARQALDQLMSLEHTIHACDTEVADIDVKNQSPVGNGTVTCATIYCGPGVDFGSGDCLWIDNLDANRGLLNLFKPYFESETVLKVWHNYGFDRHVLYNEGIDCLGFGGDTMHMARLWDASRNGRGGYSLEGLSTDLLRHAKISMKDRFGQANVLKDGSLGKLTAIPAIEELQRQAQYRAEWVRYSALDAKLTWELFQALRVRLKAMPWRGQQDMFAFYRAYYRPFGELLTDMERSGIFVRREYLSEIAEAATTAAARDEATFLDWAASQCPDARFMNARSDTQKQQLLFGLASPTDKSDTGMEHMRWFKTENTDGYIEPGKSKPLKTRSFALTGLGLPYEKRAASGKPSACSTNLRALAGPAPLTGEFGLAVDAFPTRQQGEQACIALDAVLQCRANDTLLKTFILPLPGHLDQDDRVHCSMNLNTETGRLSARRPNLQNQPALEKDIYKLRSAFAAPPGRKLIIADYSQLELRLLAHLSQCSTMIEAFQSGGDLHSRTAVQMFPHVKKAVEAGEVLVESTGGGEEDPLPLLKDVFASERRKAKGLNFSIAYGKTSAGLAADWHVTRVEAEELLALWYAGMPEVRDWQEQTRKYARKTGAVRTMMGRYRRLPDINARSFKLRGHAERAAINTPIQGSAADVVMKAMLVIHGDERLRRMGWRLLLQIHDEVIMEGPEDSAEEALAILKQCMEHPFDKPLLVGLDVSGNIGDNWYEAK